jgi:hypothetical protein
VKVNENEVFGAKTPELKLGRLGLLRPAGHAAIILPLEQALTACTTLPALNHMTVVPGTIVRLAGLKLQDVERGAQAASSWM